LRIQDKIEKDYKVAQTLKTKKLPRSAKQSKADWESYADSVVARQIFFSRRSAKVISSNRSNYHRTQFNPSAIFVCPMTRTLTTIWQVYKRLHSFHLLNELMM
jgi:hypothetical protein